MTATQTSLLPPTPGEERDLETDTAERGVSTALVCQHAHCVWLRTLPDAKRRRIEGDPERGCPGCGGTGLDPIGDLPSAPGDQP